MIIPRLSEEEQCLVDILRHPVFCSEFLRNLDLPEDSEPWELAPYQTEMLCDHNQYVSLCCARAIGKCLEENQRILNTDTGEYLSVSEWYKLGLSTLPTLKNNFNQGQSSSIITNNGIKSILQIDMAKGFQNKVTYEHPFMTPDGWVKAVNLRIGDYIAVPRELSYFGNREIDDLDLAFLAHFIAEGQRRHVTISTTEPEVYEEMQKFAKHRDMSIRWVDSKCVRFKGKYRLQFLEKFNLRNCYSYEKFIPAEIFSLSRRQIALFLNRLFSDDGWCYLNDNSYEIGYATTSEQLARDIKHLLIRFGIIASLSFSNNDHKGRWSLSIKGADNCKKFLEIGFIVERKQVALEQIYIKDISTQNTADILPLPNYREYKVKDIQPNRNPTTRTLNYYPTLNKSKRIINPDEQLEKFQRVYWVKITSIQDIGKRQTYNIEVPEDHTLVAEDVYSHNSEEILDKTSWYMINNFFTHDPISIITPNRVHLEPLFSKLKRWLNTHSFLQHYVSRQGVNSSLYNITAKNSFQLDCRIAGTSGGGANVVGLHAAVEMVDEAGYFPWGTWIELQPTLNNWIKGSQMFVSGVPTGQREKNVLYFVDQVDPNYTRFNISQHQNPRYTESDEIRNRKQYGGVESEDYIHLVLGRHGTPVFSLFDREKMKIQSYDVFVSKVYGMKLKENPSLLSDLIKLLPDPPRAASSIAFGVDLGYSEPTVISVLYKMEMNWRFLARLVLYQVPYPKQQDFLAELNMKYSPSFIGMDAGGPGKVVVQNLINDPGYRIQYLHERIIAVDYNESLSVGFDQEGKELKERAKIYGMQKLQEMANNHSIVFSSTDEDVILELERTVYSRSPSGNIIYKTITDRGSSRGDDHNVASLLSFVLGWFFKYDRQMLMPPKPKLMTARWIS